MNTETLDLLREALPYIQKFQGKTFIVKFSGKVTEDRENLASLAEELALLYQVGIRVCVIHGGGKQLTELAKKLGVVQTVIEGRRVLLCWRSDEPDVAWYHGIEAGYAGRQPIPRALLEARTP